MYSKFVTNPLNGLDDGSFFKKGFYYIVKLASIGIVVWGFYLIFADMFGATGFFKSLKGMEVWPMIRSILFFLTNVVISALAVMWLTSVLWKRSEEFKEVDYNGVPLIVPRFIKLIGQLVAVVIIATSVTIAAAHIFVVPAGYFPLIEIFERIGNNPISTHKYVVEFTSSLPQLTFYNSPVDGFGDYIQTFLFNGAIWNIIKGIIVAFLNLAVFYFIAEIFEIIIYFLIRKQLFK
ncbi:MAG: hypothetical protein JXR58_10130 [Bacteroidales bacterium]|nr:hypothetical protein [Bacteroidales bacterium]